ncbi:hypothetical protein OPQ81_007538 [Rhizoctonia solani]|nr:hypothetical protein OPQ81_007538 [Rhizoctonia solani]
MLESSVTEIAVAAVTVAVGAAFYFGAPKPSADGTVEPDQDQTSTTATSTSKKSGKKNKKKAMPGIRATSGEDTAAEEPPIPLKPQPKEKEVTPKPEVPPSTSTAPKKKKKKAKAPVPGIETTLSQAHAQPSAGAYESSSANDGAWTRVETRRKANKAPTGAVLSDGLTTSVTGTEDEAEEQVKQRTLAERLLPAGRKTGVEDMLETPQYPDVARVMRVKPVDEPQPAPGYSWGDYEDVDKVLSLDEEETDEGGWGVVKSRKPKRSQTITQATSAQAKSTSDPSAMTKKQRQNAAKRDATKAAKADAEDERLAKLAAHKRVLERERIAEAYAKPAAGKGKASGGMTASVNDKGSLVWD